MKLGTKGRYAVMALADLVLAGRKGPVNLADIAARQDISVSYLEQLFAKLRRQGIVESVRGPGGGYRLRASPGETRVSAIVFAVDEPIDTTRCEPGARLGCTGKTERCLTHDLWAALRKNIVDFLDGITLEDVVEGRVRSAHMAAPSIAQSLVQAG